MNVLAARAHAAAFDFEGLEALHVRLLKRAPQHPGVHHLIGETYEQLKLPGRALERYEAAAEALQNAVGHFEEGGIGFEACRHRINLATALIRTRKLRAARTHLKTALEESRDRGYDRQHAQAMNGLGSIAFTEGKLDVAEAHCLQSNQIARPRDFYDVIFANCYYLWRIAESRGDHAGIALNERTLRAYLSRVDPFLTEVEQYRKSIAGGGE